MNAFPSLIEIGRRVSYERAPVSDPIPAGARAASEAPKRDPNAVIAECQRQMARCLGFGYHAGQEL